MLGQDNGAFRGMESISSALEQMTPELAVSKQKLRQAEGSCMVRVQREEGKQNVGTAGAKASSRRNTLREAKRRFRSADHRTPELRTTLRTGPYRPYLSVDACGAPTESNDSLPHRLRNAGDIRKPLRRDNVWTRYMKPQLEPIGLAWATFQVMRRSYATWSRKVGVDAHTRSAQMGNHCRRERE